MNWTEVNVYTTTEGIEPVCGRLLGVGVTGFAIRMLRILRTSSTTKQATGIISTMTL